MKLKPRTKPHKTSEDQREEQCKGPDRELELWLEHNKKVGEQYRMGQTNSQGPAHAGQEVGNFFQARRKAIRGF